MIVSEDSLCFGQNKLNPDDPRSDLTVTCMDENHHRLWKIGISHFYPIYSAWFFSIYMHVEVDWKL